jgi:hypothetical protein
MLNNKEVETNIEINNIIAVVYAIIVNMNMYLEFQLSNKSHTQQDRQNNIHIFTETLSVIEDKLVRINREVEVPQFFIETVYGFRSRVMLYVDECKNYITQFEQYNNIMKSNTEIVDYEDVCANRLYTIIINNIL